MNMTMFHSKFEMSTEECQALWSLLEREWIPYDKEKVHEILTRMRKFLDEHQNELVAGDNKTT